MIAQLQGRLVEKTPTEVVIDCHGVGYQVNISLHTYALLPDSEQVKLYTFLQVKEDAHTLVGFYEMDEKLLFLDLISVSGVGASTARMMLSGMQQEEIIRAIVNGEARLLEQIKGIGKKSAERLVLELRDKLSKMNVANNPNGGFALTNKNTPHQDAVQALVSLGIQKAVAEKAVDKTIQAEGAEMSLESLIKAALKNC